MSIKFSHVQPHAVNLHEVCNTSVKMMCCELVSRKLYTTLTFSCLTEQFMSELEANTLY